MIDTETRFVLQPAAAVHLEGWTVDLIAPRPHQPSYGPHPSVNCAVLFFSVPHFGTKKPKNIHHLVCGAQAAQPLVSKGCVTLLEPL